MPIEIGVWRLGKDIEKIDFSVFPTEDRLEDLLASDISMLDPNLLLIGRQIPTKHGTYMDLLALDADGKAIVIELKRDRTPREVVAQLLDYGSWVRTLQDEDLAGIFDAYQKKYRTNSKSISLDEAFREKFQVEEIPETLNEGHELVVVASELDYSTERIINYLSDEYGVAVNAVFFRYFKDAGNEYLSRVWLIDPGEVEAKTVEKRGEEPWNGEYYVSFGHGQSRQWDDACKYGYIAAGGGAWYSRTLEILEPGARIWVNVPGHGYVGVGHVIEKVKPITEFTVPSKKGEAEPVHQVISGLPAANKPQDELECFVRVEWIKAVSLEKAVKEKGFFGNQNSAAKPKSKKWSHTVERLKECWNIKD